MIAKLFPPYTWQTKLIATAALCVAFFLTGWVAHGWKKDATLARSISKAIKTARTLQEKADPIVDQAVKEKETVRIVYRTIKEKIHEQNDKSVCFSNDSLKLWNDAIGANPDSHRSKPVAEVSTVETSAGESGEKRKQDPGTEIVATVEQVLSNAADNFETCNLNAIDHDRLVDMLNIYKGRICVCGR
ncbi:hypothetical protein [Methylophilus sp. Leaf414]|uniref:hypothetical protein n=1 Tax=Methylophilus sp. Leaf414 TaxID=1736371 RepID=UPI000700C5F6|nr:hypothetical protein [Methylophilus sp. Leaf414]KQT37668.1 hypothetical protein ASG24_01345 [Methylophilus sp. Leaf414]